MSTKNLQHLLSNCPSRKSLTLLIGVSHLGDKDCKIIELFECLPMIERLTTYGYVIEWLVLDSIKCSPKLEKIKLEIDWEHECSEEYPVVWEEYSDVWLEHLNELEIECFSNSKPEMEFVKFILARSPKLKKVNIISTLEGSQESEMLKTLLQAPRASPVMIIVT
ncbi:hypothetical protein L1987_51682 [Smallanthus sonchifolius]|uniref:Uncharacterized protein n=1 Tax=Smallanthus sonchifolius TaxID=185202 RepID=A0ACB9ERL9_9ASTR|nr:hypothetical protein L1987_51682 [Smallanthus sonchifolius]